MISQAELLGVKDFYEIKTGTVSQGSTETLTITPEAGTLYKLIEAGFYVAAVGAGDGGTHAIELYTGAGNGYDFFYNHKSAYDTALSVRRSGIPYLADNSQFPANDDEQILSISQIWASPSKPVTMRYKNSAAALDQTNQRIYCPKVLVYKQVL